MVAAFWSFGAKNAQWSDAAHSGGMWFGKGAKPGVSPRDDGGFTVSAEAAVHAVRLDPGYPWLEIEVDSFVAKAAQGTLSP